MTAIVSRAGVSRSRLACIAILGAALSACAGASRSPSSAAPMAEPMAEPAEPMSASDARAEIGRLWSQIEDWQGRGARPEAGSVDVAAEAEVASEPAADRAPVSQPMSAGQPSGQEIRARLCPDQRGAMSPVCNDVCTLAGSICDNAESICRLAGELAGDEWARNKCTSAQAACARATERCCECDRGQ